ncbi:MAG: electron transfer flavoprotein subunit alpha/FixB family protein [Planctomycetota bacterium]
MNHQGVWIVAEQSDGRIAPVGHELLRRGRALADKRRCALTAVAIGPELFEADLTELIERGADNVVAVEDEHLRQFDLERYAACLRRLIRRRRPEIVIAAATTTGRTLMPYVAVAVDAGLTADCTLLDIDDETGRLLQTRPAIGGNVMATIETPTHRPQMATVRPHSTRPADRDSRRTGKIERLTAGDLPPGRVRRVDFIPDEADGGIQDAKRVVAVGRGIQRADNIAIVRDLAEAMGAALGATREVVDRGWLSYSHQIGLSGKTITPKLYVGVGVSGSIQHLAGMQTAETIVAVNNDPDAQLFRVADLGIVGDLFEVVPKLTERVRLGVEIA